MAPEPERPIEKLLRRIAKKRREQSGQGFELDAFGRRRLQSEVERQFPATGPEPRRLFNWLLQFGPRLAYAVALVAVLGAVVFLGLPMLKGPSEDSLQMAALRESEKSSKLEKTVTVGDEIASDTKEAEAKSPAPAEQIVAGRPGNIPLAATEKDSDALGTFFRRDSRVASERFKVETGATSPDTYASTAGLGLEKQKVVQPARELSNELAASGFGIAHATNRFFAYAPSLWDNKPAAPPASAAVPPPAAAAPPPMVAALPARETPTPGAAQVVAGYVQQPLQNLGDPGKKQITARKLDVLASFSIEQTGDQLRVIDRDGSVYTGAVEVARGAASVSETLDRAYGAAVGGRGEARALKGVRAQPQEVGLRFRVTGMNRSVVQNVVFEGRLNAVTNAYQLAFVTNALQLRSATNAVSRGQALFQNMAGALQTPVQQNPAVSGKATLEDGSQLEIEAVPAGVQR